MPERNAVPFKPLLFFMFGDIRGGKPQFCLVHIKQHKKIPSLPDSRFLLHEQIRNKQNDFIDFFPLFLFEFLQTIIQIHQKHGLKIKGFPGAGIIMDNPLLAAFEIRFQRQNISVPRNGHIIILEIMPDIVLLAILLDFSEAALMQRTKLVPHQQKSGTAFVFKRRIIGNAAHKSGIRTFRKQKIIFKSKQRKFVFKIMHGNTGGFCKF